MKFKGVHVCRRWVSLEDNRGIFREGFWSLPISTSLATAASLSAKQSTSWESFIESNWLLERNWEHWSRKLREFWMVDPWHLTAIAPSTQNLQLPTTCYISVRIWICHQEPLRRMIYTAVAGNTLNASRPYFGRDGCQNTYQACKSGRNGSSHIVISLWAI